MSCVYAGRGRGDSVHAVRFLILLTFISPEVTFFLDFFSDYQLHAPVMYCSKYNLSKKWHS